MDLNMKDGGIWLLTALEHVRDGVIGVDTAGAIVCMNPAAERLTGRQEIHVKGRPVDSILNSPEEESGNPLGARIQEVIDSGTAVNEPGPQLFDLGSCPVCVNLAIAPVFKGRECRGAVIVLSGHVSGSDSKAGARLEETGEKQDVSGQKRTRRILVMDDDDVVRNLTVQKLVRLGYESEGAIDGEEAVSKFKTARDSGNPFDVVVLDLIVRGGMGGKDTLEMLMEVDPGVKAILTSGHAVDPVLTNFWEYGFFGVIRKPFVIKELDVTIRQALAME